LISVNNISLNFGTRRLFENVSFNIAGKDRIGLVGSNGAGKSTLLKIINKQIESDEGVVTLSRHTTIGYLPQEGVVYKGKTVFDEVLSAAGDIKKIEAEIKEIENELNSFADYTSDDYMDLIQNLSELQDIYLNLDGFKLQAKVEKLLKGLGFSPDDFHRMTDEFSGGWQMRIAIAKLLLINPSILLLDEPTNHLDIESLLWFEDYLKNYNGAILLISHDKNFLDNITNKIVEISLGKVTIYPGNYQAYLNRKEERKILIENQFNNQQKYLKQQEKFIERFRYKASKAKAVQSRIKQLEKIDLVEIEDEENTVDFKFPPATHSGKVTLEIENLYKSYDGIKIILEDLNLIVSRGEKIAFVGVNGAGKSTLVKMISGIEPVSKGIIKTGYQVQIKYYSQNQADELDGEKTVLETLEAIATGEVSKNLRSILGSFLFRGDDVFKKVKVLSGGEKSRLALAKMLVEPSNLLILDEPTNHLDMKSKEVLMNALKNYEGTVLVVSHDRQFLDGIVDKVIEVKNKKIKVYYGNCSEYIINSGVLNNVNLSSYNPDNLNSLDLQKSNSEKNSNRNESKNENLKQEKLVNNPPEKMSYNDKKNLKKELIPVRKRISEIEKKISGFESRKKQIEELMAHPDFYKNPDSKKTLEDYEILKKDIEDIYQKWDIENEKLLSLETLIN